MPGYGRSYGIYRRQVARGLIGRLAPRERDICRCGRLEYLYDYRSEAKPACRRCVECIREAEKKSGGIQ